MTWQEFNRKIDQLSIFHYFLALIAINVFLISLAIIFYNGHFLLWHYPFSYSGGFETQEDLPNTLSSHLYSASMFLSGIIMFALAYRSYRNSTQRNLFRILLAFVCGSGFLISAFNPDDVKHGFHVLGSALVVSTLWILATNYLFEIRDRLGSEKYFVLQALLQVPIFVYAGFFFADSDLAGAILQKIALFGLCFTLLYAIKIAS